MTEHVEWSEPEVAATPVNAAVTPADAADAARLVAFGLQPKLQPARDQEYTELLRRYREDPPFARLADAVATGLGLVVLEVSPRAGMAVTAAEDSVFAVRMGDYARRTAADSGDRFLHGLAHLAVAAMAFPRPEDLADDGYIGRVSVNGVDAFVRQACRRLEERAEEQGENTDPATDAPGLEAAWRIWARRSAAGATKDARRLAGSTTGIVGKAVVFLTDSGFLQRTGDDSGGTYRTTARYQLQVRDMAGSAALAELLELGIVPVTDGTASLLPPRTPTTWNWSPTPDCRSTPDPASPAPSPDLRPRTPLTTTRVRTCTSCPGSASTPSGRPVRATPTPCWTCGVSARPCPTPRPPRRSSSRTSPSARRAGPRPPACSSWRTAAASPYCSS
ncbi:hypothetical protein SAV14893_066030 [Streptomyces avermitilis]|uniref:Uncharacterized protein n=1 Tax=Streptomyces avermitilis TaxID=33903 RepID=A0A4D4M5P9_STRAX|nr:hypothetical protein SAVMC3_78740 [Streptomyces avermitilis]GDY67210.1 hypothetical protein SAV14893_066030 [Streptomyces avermitilis]